MTTTDVEPGEGLAREAWARACSAALAGSPVEVIDLRRRLLGVAAPADLVGRWTALERERSGVAFVRRVEQLRAAGPPYAPGLGLDLAEAERLMPRHVERAASRLQSAAVICAECEGGPHPELAALLAKVLAAPPIQAAAARERALILLEGATGADRSLLRVFVRERLPATFESFEPAFVEAMRRALGLWTREALARTRTQLAVLAVLVVVLALAMLMAFAWGTR